MADVVAAGSSEWCAFALAHPDALPYHHPAWAAALADAYGYEPLALVLCDGGGIVGGLPFVELGGRLRPRRWVALPFSDVCPPLGPASAVATAFVEDGRARGVDRFEIHGAVPGFESDAYERGVVHELDLRGGADALFHGFDPAVRRNVRKAERSGVVVRPAAQRRDLTERYYRLHAATRHRLGVPPQPRRFFDALWRHVLEPGVGVLLLAEIGGEPVAGAVFLHWNRRVVYKYGASDPRHWPARPNNLLFWECIRTACADGALTLDFGRSDLGDAGLRAFKRGWGAVERGLAYTAFGHGAAAPRHDGRLLRGLLRHTPELVGRAAGAALYRLAG